METQTMYRAEIVIREWGEPDRYQWIGPFWAEDKDTLRGNLEAGGDEVVSIEECREEKD